MTITHCFSAPGESVDVSTREELQQECSYASGMGVPSVDNKKQGDFNHDFNRTSFTMIIKIEPFPPK